MKLSRSTILAPIPGRDDVLMVQPLTGQAALLDWRAAAALSALRGGAALPPDVPEETLRSARFVVESDGEDDALLAAARAKHLAEIEKTATQLVVVPSFECNLSCTYCYQEAFDPGARGLIAPEVVGAFFAYVDRFHDAEAPKPYLTLFGGEPLVDTAGHRDRLSRFLRGARERGLSVATVTNGYDLEAFVPILADGPVKEVQVTLDGPAEVHDRRRPHASGKGTFTRIVRGIEALVASGIPVNLRVVVDRANLGALPDLARNAADRGWLELPESRFKVHVGRNYELFGCARRQPRADLFDRVELWARFVEVAEANPLLRRLHRPRFYGIRHLANTGELPAPNLDACPAAKKEWAFAPDGGLYGCTATVGNSSYRLGSFYPKVERDEAAIARWRERSVLTLARCRGCAVAAVCGGGCGALAAARTGDIQAPDCRPVRELFGLGARYYGLGLQSMPVT